jgi:thiol-disulfide isomerase/thioredoxin
MEDLLARSARPSHRRHRAIPPSVTRTERTETKGEGAGGGPTQRQKWLGLARDVAIGVGIVIAVQWWRAHDVAAEGLPERTLTLLDGTSVPLSGARERPLLVQMEASWCGVCRMEDASIRALAEDHDVLVVASQSGDAAAMRRFAEEHDLDHLRIAVDQDGRLAEQLGISAFPTTIFVDREGRVSDAEVGYTSELGMRARLAWAGL